MLSSASALLETIKAHDGISTRELMHELDVPEESLADVTAALLHLVEQGKLVRDPGDGWLVPDGTPWRAGLVTVARRGHAYVSPVVVDVAGDYFIPPAERAGAFDGDLVVVEELAPRGRGRGRGSSAGRNRDTAARPRLREARIVDVLRRRGRLVPGVFLALVPRRGAGGGKAAGGMVMPLEKGQVTEIFVGPASTRGASEGDKVLVRLLEGVFLGGQPQGEIVSAVPDDGSYESDFQTIVAETGVPIHMPREAAEEAAALPSRVTAAARRDRTDLRELVTFTIDPAEAEDYDDALSLETLANGHLRVGVHIADVSHYVRPDSGLDRMAQERGTSVYLPGRVVPMLPEALSNGLASLRPRVDRLAKTVFLDFDAAGAVVGTRILKSVIRSQRRFTYNEVLAILESEPRAAGSDSAPAAAGGARDAPAGLLPADHARYEKTLWTMGRLRDLLRERRRRRGSLELEIPSARLVLNSQGEVIHLDRDESDPSHQLVEEFMLAANEAVAQYLSERRLPLIARTHAQPEKDVLEDFYRFVEKISGRKLGARRAKTLARTVRDIRDEPYGPIVHLFLLRSLSHAEYAAETSLHFALASERYCHFTSPIRRYPDLAVHQVLDDVLAGALGRERRDFWNARLPPLALHASEAERRAEKAERDMVRVRLIRHLKRSVGEEMVALITSVHAFGFFVQVEDLFVDGLVHVSGLRDDHYEFLPLEYALRGRATARSFRIGDRVRVVLAEVNPDLREVRFEYAGRLKDGRRPEGGPRAKRADSKERGKEQGKHAAKGGRQARAGGGGKRDKRSRDRTSGRARRR